MSINAPIKPVSASRRILPMAALWALCVGAIAPWLPESTPVWDVLNILVGSLLPFAWVRYDADARGLRRGYLMKLLVAGAPIAGVPVYLLRSRTLARALLAQLLFVFVLIGLVVLTLAGALASLAAGGGLR